MNYWFGYRIFNSDIDIKDKLNKLSEAFPTYEKAKLSRMLYNSKEFERTSIFEATSKEEALNQMKLESYNRL